MVLYSINCNSNSGKLEIGETGGNSKLLYFSINTFLLLLLLGRRVAVVSTLFVFVFNPFNSRLFEFVMPRSSSRTDGDDADVEELRLALKKMRKKCSMESKVGLPAQNRVYEPHSYFGHIGQPRARKAEGGNVVNNISFAGECPFPNFNILAQLRNGKQNTRRRMKKERSCGKSTLRCSPSTLRS